MAQRVLQGDERAAARLISLVEEGDSSARAEIGMLYSHTGRAHVVGVTGPTGSGKSTLVDQLIVHLRRAGKKVGVIAVDPSSPFTGGAMLGDRIRMQRHGTDEGVFIRSMASRGEVGGLARAAPDAVHVLDAFGCQVILLETAGVGQDEVEIVKTADTVLVLTVPGLGDWVQSMKAGVLEAADIFVVSKADREGAEQVAEDLKTLGTMRGEDPSGWMPPVLKVEAIRGEGVVELLAAIKAHRRHMSASARGEERRRRRLEAHLLRLVAAELLAGALAVLKSSGKWEDAIQQLERRQGDPYSLARGLSEYASANRDRVP